MHRGTFHNPKLVFMNEEIIIFDKKAKVRLGIFSFIPAAAHLAFLIYYLAVMSPLINASPEPGSIMTLMLEKYNAMLLLLAIAAVIATIVLVYDIILLRKIKHINAANKTMWILFLATFAPVSAVFFWYFLINRESKYVPVYPSVA